MQKPRLQFLGESPRVSRVRLRVESSGRSTTGSPAHAVRHEPYDILVRAHEQTLSLGGHAYRRVPTLSYWIPNVLQRKLDPACRTLLPDDWCNSPMPLLVYMHTALTDPTDLASRLDACSTFERRGMSINGGHPVHLSHFVYGQRFTGGWGDPIRTPPAAYDALIALYRQWVGNNDITEIPLTTTDLIRELGTDILLLGPQCARVLPPPGHAVPVNMATADVAVADGYTMTMPLLNAISLTATAGLVRGGVDACGYDQDPFVLSDGLSLRSAARLIQHFATYLPGISDLQRWLAEGGQQQSRLVSMA